MPLLLDHLGHNAEYASSMAFSSSPVHSARVLLFGMSISRSLPPAASCGGVRYLRGAPESRACNQSCRMISTSDAVERCSLAASLSSAFLVDSEMRTESAAFLTMMDNSCCV